MKVMQKYFLAIVPEGEFQDRVTDLKLEIRDRYRAKYALKSPAHITLKMPFVYNEAKEEKLIERLGSFISDFEPLTVTIVGVHTFGERVIYLGVEAEQALYDFQKGLTTFCKRELNLVDELSDRNFHPHMTVAFKDIKKSMFQGILELATKADLHSEWKETHVALLKRMEGKWVVRTRIGFKLT